LRFRCFATRLLSTLGFSSSVHACSPHRFVACCTCRHNNRRTQRVASCLCVCTLAGPECCYVIAVLVPMSQKWPLFAFLVCYHLHEDLTVSSLKGSRFATQVQAHQASVSRLPSLSSSDASEASVSLDVPDAPAPQHEPVSASYPAFPPFVAVDGFELDVALLLSAPL
jgi:hypothetical protein